MSYISNIDGLSVNPIATVKQLSGFDVSTIWQMVWGYTGIPYPAKWIDSSIPGLSGARSAIPPKRDETTLSNKGVPLYAIGDNKRPFFLPVWLKTVGTNTKILLPVCTVSGGTRKVVVETPMTGRRGAVKELVRSEDYTFSVRGLCFNYERKFPEDQIELLNNLYNGQESYNIINAFTEILISNIPVLIQEINFPEFTGSEHVRPFELKLVTDESFDLYID